MQLSKTQKKFSSILCCLSENNITLIAYLFTKLEIASGVVREQSKKPHSRTPFDSQHTKGSQTPLKFSGQQFYHFLHPSEGN